MMMMKLSKVALVCLILALVVGAQRRREGWCVDFTLDADTKVDDFKRIIHAVRSLLTSSYVRDFPSMNQNLATGIGRYGLIRIQIPQGVVTIVIDINDLYVVGFHSNNPDAAKHTNAYFYLKDDKKPDGYSDAVGLFEGATAQALGYGVRYGSLGNRETTPLGRDALIGAVTPLYTRSRSFDDLKQSFLVIIQMISECVRFDYILNRIVENFDTGVLPDDLMLRLENSWGTVSDAVRNSDMFGNLQSPITLPPITPDQEQLTVNHISLIIFYGLVSLLKRPGSKSSPRHFQYCSPYGDQNSLIMANPMITTTLPVLQQQDHHGTSVLAAGEELEITTSIAGPNGMCLDVSGGLQGINKLFPSNVKFEIGSNTQAAPYKTFIGTVRQYLTSEIIKGFPSMNKKLVTGTDRYGLVKVQIRGSPASVTLVIEINNLYLAGFGANNSNADPADAYYYFTYSSQDPDAYADAVQRFGSTTTAVRLRYGDSYRELGGRSKVPLGRKPFIDAITKLYNHQDLNELKASFVVVIQMISEAVRSGFVTNFVAENFYSPASANDTVTKLENNWSKLSKAVRDSGPDGTLTEEIDLDGLEKIKTLAQIQTYELVSLLLPDRRKRVSDDDCCSIRPY
ncbi:hypothetical protein Tsubulata_027007 [Turnera subulata]|uniref:rRNA N-glycosidase n=1 Tax=Turnera subulata TaxID=218843 RepID=A0A9Q0GHN0_9ROSI|nr:hypothetical protein Tsubulata_027007 [Turnera subulata]